MDASPTPALVQQQGRTRTSRTSLPVRPCKSQPSNSKRWQDIPLWKSISLGVFCFFWGGWGGPIVFKISDPKQNDISKHCTKPQPSNSKRWKVIPSRKSMSFLFFFVFLGGWGGPIFFKISDPKQNDISEHCTKSQTSSSKSIYVFLVLGVFGFFWGVGVVQFFSKFQIQSRMILVNTVPNPNLLTQSVSKISHRENPCLFGGFFEFFGGLGWSDFFQNFGSKAEWY